MQTVEKHPKHHGLDLLASFPWDAHSRIWDNQREALELVARQNSSLTLEMPTGSGKTAVGITFLKSLQKLGAGPLFYIAPTKTIVEQVVGLYPDPTIRAAYGRGEHECLYDPYADLHPRADEIPCSLLLNCAHRVSQDTGQVFDPSATPCPYLLQKYIAKEQGSIVVCTFAFYLFTRMFSKEWNEPAGLVIDEAHQLAKVVRSCLSYDITDYHLWRCIDLLKDIGARKEAEVLDKFTRKMIRIVKRRGKKSTPILLEDHEIIDLMEELDKVDSNRLLDMVKEAVRSSSINPVEKREILKKLETLLYDIRRYLHSFEYSLNTDERRPLNYTYAYMREELEGNERVRHKLVICAYYVASLISKCLLSPFTVAYSATIGDPDVLKFETGIKAPCYTFPSTFPAENTGVFLPTDTPNLAVKERTKKQPAAILRRIVAACRLFASKGVRSLVVVVSDRERQRFLDFCANENVNALSYGNGTSPKDVAARFREGEGDVLVGTVANYGEGIDHPRRVAPVTFILRPAYPPPHDPEAQFEERRFGRQRWAIWNWRVMIEALQARGRNVRSEDDVGVTIFISQQFRRFLYGSLPKWLERAYKGDLTFDQCVNRALELLGKGGKRE